MSNGEKQAVTFRPKRQWKPKRRDRNQKRRMKRRRWYRKNRNKIRQKSKRRYKRLRKNPAYKRWQARKRREKTKRKFRQAMVSPERSEEFTIAEGIPEIYFLFDESESTVDVDLGVICDVDPDEDEILVWDLDDGEYKVVSIEDFVEYAVFLEEDDEDNFYTMMEKVYEDVPDEDTPDVVQRVAARHWSRTEEIMPSLSQRVANRYLEKRAFNKENPSDLLAQIVKVLNKASKDAEGAGKKGLVDIASRVKGLSKDVQTAWDKRNEE